MELVAKLPEERRVRLLAVPSDALALIATQDTIESTRIELNHIAWNHFKTNGKSLEKQRTGQCFAQCKVLHTTVQYCTVPHCPGWSRLFYRQLFGHLNASDTNGGWLLLQGYPG